jgi:hypothetical protein
MTVEKLSKILAQIEDKRTLYDYDTREYQAATILEKYRKWNDITFRGMSDLQIRNSISERSKYIESLFLHTPHLQFCANYPQKYGKQLNIIIGCYCISDLISYLENDLILSGLEKLTELNGTKFNELPDSMQTRFLHRSFRFHIIASKDDEIHYDIIDRSYYNEFAESIRQTDGI